LPDLKIDRAIGVAGASIALISLIGLPWYVITVRIASDISYVLNYSPFSREMKFGLDHSKFEWFYGFDATLIGMLCASLAVLSQIAVESRKVRILSPAFILLVTLLFLTLLPIHATTASRLSFGPGVLLAGLGALLIWFSRLISSIIVSASRFPSYLLTILGQIPLLPRIFLIAVVSYYIIYVMLRLLQGLP
jgi:hypothetical protein